MSVLVRGDFGLFRFSVPFNVQFQTFHSSFHFNLKAQKLGFFI